MLRSIKKFTPLVSISLFSRSHEHDVDQINALPPEAPKTGWERVKKMYSKTEDGEVSLELHHVTQSAMSGFFIGACMGGFVQSRNAYLYFIENNQATIFKTTAEAKKKLQDYVTLAFAKGAVRWGWRLSLFSGLFSLTATTISTYRGDISLIEYISAGAITGGLFKINLGLAATFVGAGLGAVLGTIFGGIIVLILKVTGMSIEDIRKAMYKFKEGRLEQFNQVLDKSSETKSDPLARHHSALVYQKGEQKVEDI